MPYKISHFKKLCKVRLSNKKPIKCKKAKIQKSILERFEKTKRYNR